MSKSMIICPNILQVLDVWRVTSPVTQVAVVAVKRESIYPTRSPVAELMGSVRIRLPIRIAARKLKRITCVVESFSLSFFFIT